MYLYAQGVRKGPWLVRGGVGDNGSAPRRCVGTVSGWFEGVNPLEGKGLFVTSQATYHPTASDHLRADNSAPGAAIPFVFKLPPSKPILTKALVKTSTVARRERDLAGSPAPLALPPSLLQ